MKIKNITSPLNYAGSKYKLLPQLLPLFPKDIEHFIDAFCGGGSVAANVGAYKITAIDSNLQLIQVHQYIANGLINVNSINEVIERYGLNREDKEAYLHLRRDYNEDPCPIKLFTLICHSFSNSIRFNNKGGFNIPFGKRTFNEVMQANLKEYAKTIRDKKVEFVCDSVFNFMFAKLGTDDFVYCDPPYLITDATYNTGWGETEERELLKLLDRLSIIGVKWGLSNVLHHKGKSNDILIAWAKDKRVFHLSNNYANCNYQTNRGDSSEVFITNY